jgi:hypothetical protein
MTAAAGLAHPLLAVVVLGVTWGTIIWGIIRTKGEGT